MSASRATSAASRAHAGSSTSTAIDSSGVTSGAALDRLAQAAHGRLAVVGRQPVEHEHAVEVVDLVLDDAGLAALGVDHEARAVLVAGDDAHARGARDLDPDAGQAEAAPGETLPLPRRPHPLGGVR